MNNNLLLFLSLCVASSYTMDKQASNIENHPLMKSANQSLLLTLATKVSACIDNKFSDKKQVLVGLGQSPAYLLEMIKLIDSKKSRTDRSYLNIAFSGSCYDNHGIDRYLYNQYNKLGHHYTNYLNQAGLSQEALDKKDTEHIVLEVCHEANGLKSFLSFFTDYSKKPHVIYLQHNFFNPVYLPVKNERLSLDDDEEKLAVALANADAFKDRLVPQFQFHKWETVKPLEFKPEENAPVILKQLEQFIENAPSSQEG